MATGRTIIRVKHRRSPFAVIDRRLLEDSRLSWAARGVLGYLFAKPDDWTLNVEDLRRRGDLGRDALYKILKHLQRVGYVRREFTRDANGRVTGVVYAVFEVPEAPFPEKPDTARPETAAPDTAAPFPAKPTLLNNHSTKEPVNQITTTTTDGDDGAKELRGGEELMFPNSLSGPAVAQAKRMLAAFSLPLAQALLDELAGRTQANAVRGTPLAYLRGLVKRAQAGDFTPEAGLSIAEDRERRRRSERAVTRATASVAPLPPADESNLLVQRLNRIRARERARENGAEDPGGTPQRDHEP